MLDTEKAMREARETLVSHPMCAKLIEQKGRIIVMFPLGYRIDAAQMRYKQEKVSKTKAFELLANTCEKYWKLGISEAR
jgi:hypothetical protein